MEDILKIIFSAENVRMAVLLVAAASGVTWLRSKMDKRFSEQDDKIRSLRDEMNGKFTALRDEMNGKFAAMHDEIRGIKTNDIPALRDEIREIKTNDISALRDEIRELKTNDIAHLYAAIEALVFSMVKNKTLTETDQQYINDRLHSTH